MESSISKALSNYWYRTPHPSLTLAMKHHYKRCISLNYHYKRVTSKNHHYNRVIFYQNTVKILKNTIKILQNTSKKYYIILSKYNQSTIKNTNSATLYKCESAFSTHHTHTTFALVQAELEFLIIFR